MLNIEKYEEELRPFGTRFAITKHRKIRCCKEFRCGDCAFHYALCGDNDEFKDQDVIYVWIENPKYPSLDTAGMYFFTTHNLQFAGLEYNTYYTLKDLKL